MKMRGKPNLDPMAFIEGSGIKEKPAAIVEAAVTQTPSARMTKTIRLASDLDGLLKDEAHARTKASGQRVSESDIIDEALRKYLSK
jgi:hypothetical protein